MKDRRKYNKLVRNMFCPTGPGGGVDPSCGKDSTQWNESDIERVISHLPSYQPRPDSRGGTLHFARYRLPGGGKLEIDYSSRKKDIHIDWIGEKDGTDSMSRKVGMQNLRVLAKVLKRDFPDAETVSGYRMGGRKKESPEGVVAPLDRFVQNFLYVVSASNFNKSFISNVRKKPSPTKFDPTRTTSLRRAFVGKLRRKFALLRKAIYDLLVTEDALGLKKNLTYNCRPGQIRGADGRCGPGIGVDIPRDEMPQITQEDLTAFLTFASHENVQVLARHCLARQLRPTQKEFRQERVDAMPDAALEQPVIVSRDLYVLDGTHRWIKHWQQDEDKLVPLLIIQLDLHQALDLMRRFPLSKFVANHIVKLSSGKYRLLSHEGKNLGTFDSREEAAKHEGEVEYFKQANNERWRFNTTPEQLQAFKEWLKTQVEYYITGMSDEQLWNKFIESGFKKGAGRAFDDTKPQAGWTEAEGAFYAGTKDQFLKSAFGQPESLSKVQLLAARTFDELEGMSADMQNKLGRILVDGLTKGNGPISIAREMSNQLNLSMTRAETIARTELIRAHAEGQLVGMEELGVDEVGVMVEWSTAGDDRVCELCEPMEGVVLKIEEARGMIPRHCNCRCAFIPANVAEPTDDQKRGKRSIVKAVKTSASLGKDDFSTAVPVSKERPKSVLPVIANAFCPTGPGGGQDNSCSPFSTSAVDFGEDVHKQYKDAPKIRVTDEDVANVKAALKLRGALNKDGTVTLYHDTIDDPETISSILKHGLIPSAQPASGQTWKATHSSYSTYFHQDLSAARGLQSTAADEFLTTIEARIPVTKEFLKRVIPDEESGGVHEGIAQLISGAGAPAVIGGVPAKYLSSRKYGKPIKSEPTKPVKTTHPHEDKILQSAGELNGSKYKGRLSIGARISAKLYKESGKKISLSGHEVDEVLKQHSSELSKYGISINAEPAPQIVYQFSQLLAGARK